MKIAVDAMGGDNAPEAVVCGAVRAAQNYHEEIILVGQEDKINAVLKAHNAENTPGITILHAPDLVDMHDDPATVLRAKPQSSMAVALGLVKKGEADAIVSAGSTGALLSGATLFCKRIKGVRRGAVAPVMPCKGGQVLLIDAGANTECTPEYLLQFGVMGSLYMQKIKGIANPRVGLVNNGSEDSKGDPLRREAYALLKAAGEAGHINFVGNVEGRDVPLGACDVAVCDGFAGNVMLKTIEGVAKFMAGAIKDVFTANLGTKLAYLACKKGMDDFRSLFDQDAVGGAPFIGISRPVIKAHGSSNETAFMNAIRQAIEYKKSGMIEAIEQNVQHMTAE